MSDSNSAEKHYEHAVALSRDLLKSLLLINGGAASALVALTDKTSRDFTASVVLFGAGAVFAVISTALGYGSQLSYANHRFQVSRNSDGLSAYKLHRRYQAIGIVCVSISLAFSMTGIASAMCIARN